MHGDFRIGDWVIQPQLNQVSGRGRNTRVEPKAMQVLLCLARQNDGVVSKEKLIHAVWADTFVTDDVLTRCISELRKVFEDDPREPGVIETIPRSGYRLMPPVSEIAPRLNPSGALPVRSLRRSLFLTLSATLLFALTLLALGAWMHRGTQPPESVSASIPDRVILAVMPFDNLNGQPEEEYFSDGFTAELIARLGKLPAERFGVIAWNASRMLKNSSKSVSDIGSELNAAYVVEGTIRRQDQRVAITAELIQTRDQSHLWANVYEGNLSDVLTLQHQLTTDIASAIRLKMTDANPQPQPERQVSFEAYQLYSMARFNYERRTEGKLLKSIELFRQAIHADPAFAPSYAGLSDALLHAPYVSENARRKTIAEAQAAARKGIALDEQSAEAHAALGLSLQMEPGNRSKAEPEFRKAIELNPSLAYARFRYAGFLAFWGRFDEALEQMARTRELDPISRTANAKIGYLYFCKRQYDQAIQHLEKVIRMDQESGLAHNILGNAYFEKGRIPEAIDEWERANVLFGASAEEIHAEYPPLREAYADGGRSALLRRMIEIAGGFEPTDPAQNLDIAEWYALLGDAENSVSHLERARARGVMVGPERLLLPAFDSMRSDSRFIDLQASINAAEN